MKKENYTCLTYKHKCKIFKQNTSKWNPVMYKKVFHDQLGMQNWPNMKNSYQSLIDTL